MCYVEALCHMSKTFKISVMYRTFIWNSGIHAFDMGTDMFAVQEAEVMRTLGNVDNILSTGSLK